MCAEAIEAGKNVLCDKPLCLNADEAEAMLEAHKRHSGKARLPCLLMPHAFPLIRFASTIGSLYTYIKVNPPTLSTCAHAQILLTIPKSIQSLPNAGLCRTPFAILLIPSIMGMLIAYTSEMLRLLIS